MIVQAKAKINWTLNIVGKRGDGYHLLDMLMQSLDLCDEIELTNADDFSMAVEGMGTLPCDERNLAYKAALELQKETGKTAGACIRLKKRIPIGAGLGGGSADAASVLLGLNELWGIGLSMEKLEEIALRLGADVPYCLRGIPMRVEGIGEKLTPFSVRQDYELILIQPTSALSTRDVFARYDESEPPQGADTLCALAALSEGKSAKLAACCRNMLQPASMQLRPEMKKALGALKSSGAFLSQMTGSGSVIFGAYKDEKEAKNAYERLRYQYRTCLRARTVH